MGTTSAGLRYPELTDSPNAQTAVKNLADDLNGKHVPIFATTGARDTAFPSPTNGQVCYITALDQLMVRSGGAWVNVTTTVLAYKSADETVNNSSTLQNDNHLVISVVANAAYTVDLYAIYNSNSTANLKVDYTMPAGAALSQMVFISGGTLSAIQHGVSLGTVGAVNGIAGISADTGLQMHGVLTTGGTSGNLTFRWAQNVANASNTIMRTGSYLRAQRIF